jgi:glycosyltransferase involved in cell wall biosynthesis
MKPKVTIGICARNCQSIIGSAIESVVKQDFPHQLMEIIFVDDGSEDGTLKIMQDYASKIDITSRIYSGEWRGLGKARNTIINNALGDYIIWVDADEILEKDFVRIQFDLIEKNPKAGIATAKVLILPRENLVLTLDLIPPVVEYSTINWEKSSKLPGTGGATYRVTAARQVGGFDEMIRGAGEDIDIARRIRQAGWSIIRGNAKFYEAHGQLATWKTLWKRYYNLGLQNRQVGRKTESLISIYRINPFASFVAGLIYAILGYKITKLKVAIIVPLHYTLKMTAWFYGFMKARARKA